LDYLENRNVFEVKQLMISELEKSIAVKKDELLHYSVYSQKEIAEHLDSMIQAGQLTIQESFIYEKKKMEAYSDVVFNMITNTIEKKNDLRALTLNEIAGLTGLNPVLIEVVLKFLKVQEKLQFNDDRYALTGGREIMPPEILMAYKQILAELKSNSFTPPSIESFVARGKAFKGAIGVLLKSGKVHKCGSEFLFLNATWQEITSFIRSIIQRRNELKVGELRDKFEISRKYAIPILEEADRLKITKRQGDVRIRGEAFEIQSINS